MIMCRPGALGTIDPTSRGFTAGYEPVAAPRLGQCPMERNSATGTHSTHSSLAFTSVAFLLILHWHYTAAFLTPVAKFIHAARIGLSVCLRSMGRA